MNAKTILTAAALAAAFVTGAAQAAPATQKAGEVYGYSYRVNDQRSAYTDGARVGKADPFTDGAKIGKYDPYTDGARTGKFDPYTDGARIVAGLDRTGVSSEPSRKFDPYTDGAKVGKYDPYTDGARKVAGLDRTGVSASPARNADPYLDGARNRDVYTDGANA